MMRKRRLGEVLIVLATCLAAPAMLAFPQRGLAQIVSGFPPGGTVGASYHHQYQLSGRAAAHHLEIHLSAGALPPGLSISNTNFSGSRIVGVPTTAGTYTGQVSDGAPGWQDTQTFNIRIVDPQPPAFTSAVPPPGTVGVPYSFFYTATGSTGVQFSITGGALPPGLTLAGSQISGTPTAEGVYLGTTTATTGALPDATQDFSIGIGPKKPPLITSDGPPAGQVGLSYSFSYTATGSVTISYTVTSGALPPGLDLSATGTIGGTPTASGTYAGTISATNGTAPDATVSFSITIAAAQPVAIAPPSPPEAVVGVPYEFMFTATGFPAPSLTLTGGVLPPGLALDGGGTVGGTPTAEGTYAGTVTASNGTPPDATANFSIKVTTLRPPTITSAAPQDGTVEVPYSFTYTATGSPASSFSVTSGALPPGMSLSGTGVLDGTPTLPGTYIGTVTASNGTLPDATQDFSIVIAQAESRSGGGGTIDALSLIVLLLTGASTWLRAFRCGGAVSRLLSSRFP